MVTNETNEFVPYMSFSSLKDKTLRQCKKCKQYTYYLNDHCNQICEYSYIQCNLCKQSIIRKNMTNHWNYDCINYEKSIYQCESDQYWGIRKKLDIANVPKTSKMFHKIILYFCETNQPNHNKHIPSVIQLLILHYLIYG